MIKKLLLFVCLFFTISIFACFLTQAQIFNKVVSADFDDGASWQCQFQNIQLKQKSNYRCFLWYDGIFQYGDYNTNTGWLATWFKKNNISNEDRQFYLWADVVQTFPLTVICAFHPFEIVDEKIQYSNRVMRDQNGKIIQLKVNDISKITRFCLLYWGANKKWVLHKDIRNPKYNNIITDMGQRTSLFGKYVFQNKYGLKQRQIMFIVAYFETQSGFKSHAAGLQDLRQKFPHQLSGVIRIGVLDNIKPTYK